MRIMIRVSAGAAVAVLVSTNMITAAQAATPAGWRITDVVRPCGDAPAGLFSLSAVGPADAWALGEVTARRCGAFLTHWNGTAWVLVRVRGRVASDSALQSSPVTASSASDVWIFPATGLPFGLSYSAHDYAMRWNGHRWRSSSFRRNLVVQYADAFSSRNVWAFGTIYHGQTSMVPYAARYDGRLWRVARMPGAVLGLGATSASDMWAVGPTMRTAADPAGQQALIAMHWNGRTWRAFALPKIRAAKGAAFGPGILVAVSSRAFWWAYSVTTNGNGPDSEGLLYCDSGQCRRVTLPPNLVATLAMTQDGNGGVWLSAMDESSATFNIWQEWYHYSGGRWTGEVQLSPRRYDSMYFAMAWIPGTRSVWSVGEADANSGKARDLTVGVIAQYGQ
jgi:hypothetical protein